LRSFGIGKGGFNVCSIQFAIHYMFENIEKVATLLRNVSENTAVGGYFVGTCYDGKTIFDKLKDKKMGDSEVYMGAGGDKKIWSVTKQYNSAEFIDNETSIGYAIDVYQETINNTFREYLVNFKYLTRLLNDFGFVLIGDEEAKNKGLPSGSAMFKTLYLQMANELKNDPRAKTKYGEAMNMSENEKNISYLNRYFIFKKTHNVDTSQMASILNRKGTNAATSSANGVGNANGVANGVGIVGVYNDNTQYKDTNEIHYERFKGDIELINPNAKTNDEFELYSLTSESDAKNISYMINEDNKDVPYILYDGTTSIGGNFIPFIRDYLSMDTSLKYVYGTEINASRFEKLNKKIQQLFPKLKVEAKSGVVKYTTSNDKRIHYYNKSFNDIYLRLIDQFKDDNHAIFLDPSWGGKDYKKYKHLLIGLGGESLVSIISKIKQHTKKIVNLYVKVPTNFFTEELDKNNIHFEVRKTVNGVTFNGFVILYIRIQKQDVLPASLVSASLVSASLVPASLVPVPAAESDTEAKTTDTLPAATKKRIINKKLSIIPEEQENQTQASAQVSAKQAPAQENQTQDTQVQTSAQENQTQENQTQENQTQAPAQENQRQAPAQTKSKTQKKKEGGEKKLTIKRIRKKVMLIDS